MARYPVLLAGQRLTASLMQAMQWQEFVKNAHTDRASTTTLADDPDLQCSLDANAVYRVEMYLHYAAVNDDNPAGSGTITGRLKTAWRVPSGAGGNRACIGPDQGQVLSGSGGATGRWGVHNFTTEATYGNRDSNSLQCFAAEEAVIYTSSAGTLALQWAQSISYSTASRMAQGSYMRVRRIG